MIGDTTYDIEMARNAGVGAIGVAWGYHAPARLQRRRCRYGRCNERCLLAAIDARLAAREPDGDVTKDTAQAGREQAAAASASTRP